MKVLSKYKAIIAVYVNPEKDIDPNKDRVLELIRVAQLKDNSYELHTIDFRDVCNIVMTVNNDSSDIIKTEIILTNQEPIEIDMEDYIECVEMWIKATKDKAVDDLKNVIY